MSDAAVTATLTAKDAGMSAAMEKVGHAAHKAEGMIESFKDKFKEAFSFGAGAGLGAMAGEKLAEGIKEAVKALPEFAEKMDAIAHGAEKTGLSVEAFQRLGYAFKMADIPAESMDKAFKKLNVGMAQLRVHQGPLLEGLKRLNPELLREVMHAKNGEEAFMATAEAISKETDATKRAAIANAVFGKAGVDLLPLLLKGKEGIKDLTDEAERVGAVVGGKAVEAGGKFSDSLKKVNASITGMQNALMGDLAEGINPFMAGMAEFLEKNKEVVHVIESIGVAALALVGIFAVVRGSMMAFAAISGVIKAAGIAWEAYTLFAGGAATAQEALNMARAANPIGLIVTAVALLVAGIALLAMNWDTLTGKLSPKVYHAVKGGGSNASASVRADQDKALADQRAAGTYHRQTNAEAAAAHALRVTSSAPVVHVTNYIDGVKQEPSRTEVKTASKSMGRGAAPVARPDPNSQAHF